MKKPAAGVGAPRLAHFETWAGQSRRKAFADFRAKWALIGESLLPIFGCKRDAPGFACRSDEASGAT